MSTPKIGFVPRLVRRIDHWLGLQRHAALISQLGACGEGVSIQSPVVINNPDRLRLGARVSLNAFVHIWAGGDVTIGDDTLVASHVAITSLTHDTRAEVYAKSLIAKPVVIGCNVWIGAHAVILPGVTIGDGAIVGAGAVVTRDVAPRTVVTGIPATPRT
jgi:acetyltransferase-like isoleucine patch superfamily enzyme